MMRRRAGLDTDQARWQLLEEDQHVASLELTTHDHIARRIADLRIATSESWRDKATGWDRDGVLCPQHAAELEGVLRVVGPEPTADA